MKKNIGITSPMVCNDIGNRPNAEYTLPYLLPAKNKPKIVAAGKTIVIEIMPSWTIRVLNNIICNLYVA